MSWKSWLGIAILAFCCGAIVAALVGRSVRDKKVTTESVYSEAELELYVSKWVLRDGLGSFVISDYFCDFAGAKPDVFLRVMARNPKVFQTWLRELQNLSFVDRGGCLDRGCMKDGMVKMLKLVSAEGEEERVRLDLLIELEGISVDRAD